MRNKYDAEPPPEQDFTEKHSKKHWYDDDGCGAKAYIVKDGANIKPCSVLMSNEFLMLDGGEVSPDSRPKCPSCGATLNANISHIH